MKYRALIILSAFAALRAAAFAPVAPAISDIRLEHDGSDMDAAFTVDVAALAVKSGEALILEPAIVGETDTVALREVGIYGRRRWIHAERSNSLAPIALRADKAAEPLAYEISVPWQDWMDGALLVVASHTEGCCNTPANEAADELAQHFEPLTYTPEVIYAAAPEVDTSVLGKTRELSGRANVEFVVDKTDIRPDYRNNYAELSKIRASIDSVRTDKDLTITGIWLKGFASPESPYAHNADLARGRVAAVKEYVRRLYNFPADIISTDYEPEDWAGLREYVATTNLPNREEIIRLIDGDLEPDAKEWAIRRSYPQDYKHLLTHSYPALRHTDYRIEYFIREFTDPAEIRMLARTNPGKLSVNEFHIAAQSLEPGSPEFITLYRTAAQIYPDDPTANLNAAAAAIAAGDLDLGRAYIAKAGDSVEADYLRAVIDMSKGDTAAAEPLFARAAQAGIPEAQRALDLIEKMKQRSAKK